MEFQRQGSVTFTITLQKVGLLTSLIYPCPLISLCSQYDNSISLVVVFLKLLSSWTSLNIAIDITIAIEVFLLLKSSLLWISSRWKYTCFHTCYMFMKLLVDIHTYLDLCFTWNSFRVDVLFMHGSLLEISWRKLLK